ncbi:MAG: DUF4835 domain-containing protein [Bacteroidetes bacterium GWF2_38_335]|nr:MAG: DUF4835 domain-containing protein [Bacteroidetes bacterium GWF2_38_335]OFY79502.1 MAG: DUF4835 domain-containing protein [Bacteroidetes bacterium RIFOXYA12_FULL_38_20]HBS86559.1 DUF4835 domain-containing protein [Bacteroidales bacterium]
MRNIWFVILTLFVLQTVSAQELDCRIQVISSQVQGTNKQKYETMQTSLYEFMNNRKWTNHVFSMDERIECTMIITISKEISADEFDATLTVQARRPVFNTNYYSTILNFNDKNMTFKFQEYQTLEFNEAQHTSNLTSILAFYAYVIIGLDYDSFSMEGGDEYFKKAETIVSKAQNEKEKGWKAFENERNRYWLVENLLNDKYSDFRKCMYRYHRLGLDLMSEKPEDGRAEIAESVKLLQNVYRQKPGLFILQLFFDAKADELVNIFTESFPDEKNRVYEALKEIDPANGSKYAKIREGGN